MVMTAIVIGKGFLTLLCMTVCVRVCVCLHALICVLPNASCKWTWPCGGPVGYTIPNRVTTADNPRNKQFQNDNHAPRNKLTPKQRHTPRIKHIES